MKLNKHRILHLGGSKLGYIYIYRLVDKRLKEQPHIKESGGKWDQVVYESAECPRSQKDQPYPGFHQAQYCYLVKGRDCLVCTTLVQLHFKHCVQF